MARRAFGIGIAFAFAAMAAQPAAAVPYSSLVVFGDSLVDTGNARLGSLARGLPDPAPPAAGYVGGRFSNGPNFADYLNQDINGSLSTAYLQGGQNFAVGGALTAYSPTETSPSFLPQLSLFAGTMQPIPSSALVLVTFGGNDIRALFSSTGTADFSPALATLANGLGALIGAGARNIVVTGVPDIGDLPNTRAAAAALGDPNVTTLAAQRSRQLDAGIAATTGAVARTSGANVQFFDLLAYENALVADPAAFGLAAGLRRDQSCIAAGAVATGCSGFLYFDEIHPTTQVHAAIATSIAAQLGIATAVPEPASWLSMLLGFGLLGGLLRGRRRRLPAGGHAVGAIG